MGAWAIPAPLPTFQLIPQPDRKIMDASSNIVGKAVEEWVTQLPWEGEGPPNVGVLGDWIAIACFVSVDSEGRPNAEYYVAMRDGSLLPHVTQDLLTQGADQLPLLRNDES